MSVPRGTCGTCRFWVGRPCAKFRRCANPKNKRRSVVGLKNPDSIGDRKLSSDCTCNNHEVNNG